MEKVNLIAGWRDVLTHLMAKDGYIVMTPPNTVRILSVGDYINDYFDTGLVWKVIGYANYVDAIRQRHEAAKLSGELIDAPPKDGSFYKCIVSTEDATYKTN